MAGPVRSRRLFKFTVSDERGEYELEFEDFAGRRTKLLLTAEQLRDLSDRLAEAAGEDEGVSPRRLSGSSNG